LVYLVVPAICGFEGRKEEDMSTAFGGGRSEEQDNNVKQV
jgi:hypothetical protein